MKGAVCLDARKRPLHFSANTPCSSAQQLACCSTPYCQTSSDTLFRANCQFFQGAVVTDPSNENSMSCVY